MAVRPWHLVVLVWVPFLSVFVFAALGDTSALHITSHLLAIACLVPAVVLVLRLRGSTTTRTGRVVATVLAVVLPLAVLGHLAELGVAVARLASDGWVNRDTADIWVRGPHVWAANVTVPAMMLSMLGVLVLAAVLRSARSRAGVRLPPAP